MRSFLRKNFLNATACMLMLAACTFEMPDDKPLTAVSNKSTPAVISLNVSTLDSIYIRQATVFQFKVTPTPVNLRSVDVLVNGRIIFSSRESLGSFTLDGSNWVPGTSQLKIQYTAASGTGSLADKGGTETTTQWRTWKVFVDILPPQATTLTVSKKNGFLALSWPTYQGGTFIKYGITPYRQNTNAEYFITDQNKTTFIDSTFVYGTVNYRLTIYTKNGQTSTTKQVTFTQSATSSYRVADSTVTLTWHKAPYPGATREALIKENNTVVATLDPTVDSVYSFKLSNAGFGSTATVSFTINHRYNYGNGSPFSFNNVIDNPAGAKRTFIQTYFYSQTLGKVIAHDQSAGKMRVYDNTMRATDSLFVSYILLSLPYPGRFAYYQVTFSDGVTNSIIQRDLTNGTIQQQSLASPSHALLLRGASNGFYGIQTYSSSAGISFAGIRDIASGATIKNAIFSISDDGRFATNGPEVYQYDGTTYQSIHINGLVNPRFRPDNNDELISFEAPPTQIAKTLDGTILRTITPPDLSFVLRTYDPSTKMLLYGKDGSNKCYLIDIDTQVVKTVRGAGVSFINGYLFDANGYYVKVM